MPASTTLVLVAVLALSACGSTPGTPDATPRAHADAQASLVAA